MTINDDKWLELQVKARVLPNFASTSAYETALGTASKNGDLIVDNVLNGFWFKFGGSWHFFDCSSTNNGWQTSTITQAVAAGTGFGSKTLQDAIDATIKHKIVAADITYNLANGHYYDNFIHYFKDISRYLPENTKPLGGEEKSHYVKIIGDNRPYVGVAFIDGNYIDGDTSSTQINLSPSGTQLTVTPAVDFSNLDSSDTIMFVDNSGNVTTQPCSGGDASGHINFYGGLPSLGSPGSMAMILPRVTMDKLYMFADATVEIIGCRIDDFQQFAGNIKFKRCLLDGVKLLNPNSIMEIEEETTIYETAVDIQSGIFNMIKGAGYKQSVGALFSVQGYNEKHGNVIANIAGAFEARAFLDINGSRARAIVGNGKWSKESSIASGSGDFVLAGNGAKVELTDAFTISHNSISTGNALEAFNGAEIFQKSSTVLSIENYQSPNAAIYAVNGGKIYLVGSTRNFTNTAIQYSPASSATYGNNGAVIVR